MMCLSRVLINLILEKGHSRVPVYNEHRANIIGLVLVIIFCCLSNAHENVLLRYSYLSDNNLIRSKWYMWYMLFMLSFKIDELKHIPGNYADLLTRIKLGSAGVPRAKSFILSITRACSNKIIWWLSMDHGAINSKEVWRDTVPTERGKGNEGF